MTNTVNPVHPPTWVLRLLTLSTLLLGMYTLAPTMGRIPPGQAPPPSLAETLPRISLTENRPDVPGYHRNRFGTGWNRAHIGSRTCTTHEVMLVAEFPDATVTPDCGVHAAPGRDPYSGWMMATSPTDPGQRIEVDHVYPLSAAWDMGAAEWDRSTRIRFANDPANLVVVTARQNREKSDSLPADWLPADRWARCWYVRRLAAVAREYHLALTVDDAATMQRQCLLAGIADAFF
ncbi:HNH endonuclease family protein [Corynebacterium sp. CCM 9185]|uniref:HNH endonuclease n=1 Tax=Corynebacterium marambiense TaxID=2765364 RepID=A0ABS0VX31_9CORY|nr:HNH endonuclease family protein [Corynebacterium marambiense]MBI9000170.1 HNH endonuclease [Corynebacterium marambiense]MCK7663524.1 HNH endonuclease family protein [Corynebacterium marambiense]MCX7542043.1 HNH endonuclease family protein [Corynebacterium marambiense]